MITDYPYQVFSPTGQPLMEAPESCRYPRKVELSILDAGYTIKLNGKRITKADHKSRSKANDRMVCKVHQV